MILYYASILIALYVFNFVIGLFVTYKNLRVNYARKIYSMGYFLTASYLATVIQRDGETLQLILSCIIPLIWLFSFLEPIRNKSKFLRICFSSFDRPEDRPYTIIWLSTSMVVGYWVLVGMIEWLEIYNAAHLIWITVFVSTFGDGLAEPIGVKFGQWKYKTRALFTNRTYIRTIEGSIVVGLSALAGIIGFYNEFTPNQFIAMMCIMPFAMAITEAKSPHTWDNPFLHLIGGLITVLCLQI